MVWVDYLIPTIIAVSAVFSLVRGFVREAISLVGWVLGFLISLIYHGTFARLFLASISSPTFRDVLAITILFVMTIVITALINHLAGFIVKQSGLTGTDRLIGVAFGAVRGGVIVALLILLAGMTPMPQDPWWKESMMIGHFQDLANWIQLNVAPEINHIVSDKTVHG
jgi:membrane protein required for colicin V production